jgi:Protein of unknown function (DUF3365)
MKNRINLPAVLLFTCALSVAPAADQPNVSARFIDPEAPECSEARGIGERAINRLTLTMVNEVAGAVAKVGAEKAVEVCHLKAVPTTGLVIKDTPRITAVKRTSLRLRNPANAPDAAEQLALKRVEQDLEKGVLPKVLVQQIDLPGNKCEWRVYRLIGILPQCVACHGPKDSLSSELQTLLKERYPSDQATGYALSQWRGLVRVTVAEAPPAPPSTKKKI